MKARPLTLLRWTATLAVAVGSAFAVAAAAFGPTYEDEEFLARLAEAVPAVLFYGFFCWVIISALVVGVFWIDGCLSNCRAGR